MNKRKMFLVAMILLSGLSANSAGNPLLTYQEYSKLSENDRKAYMKLVAKYFIAREKAERPSDFSFFFETMGLLPDARAEDIAKCGEFRKAAGKLVVVCERSTPQGRRREAFEVPMGSSEQEARKKLAEQVSKFNENKAIENSTPLVTGVSNTNVEITHSSRNTPGGSTQANAPIPAPKPAVPQVADVPVPKPRPQLTSPEGVSPTTQPAPSAASPLPPRPEFTAPPASASAGPSTDVATGSDSEEQRRQNQIGAARVKEAAEGLDVSDHEGDCINAGFNFIRKKGSKGACRGISDLCHKDIGTSIRGIPPLELLSGQFCSPGKDSPNGRCGSPGVLGPKVICDPLLFGVVKGENGKAKVMCVERSRNSTAACAKLSESTSDIKVVCSQGITSEACLAGENPQADLSRAYHQKILVMARDCKWTDDPLANRGVGALRSDRSVKAQKDITDTCNAIKPRLGVFKQLAQGTPEQATGATNPAPAEVSGAD